MKLKGQNVILRPLRLSDAPNFVRWFRDTQVTKFLTRRRVTLKEERQWIRQIPKHKENAHFAIQTAGGQHIGSCGLRSRPLDRNATLGIVIGDKKYWDHGYGSDAMHLLLRYGFTVMKLHRIDLDVYEYNRRAITVYKRLGFKQEGIKRQAVWHRKQFHDVISMSLLEPEWRRAKRG